VDLAHARAEVHHLEATAVEDVGVAAAAHARGGDGAAGAGGGGDDQPHDDGVLGDGHGLVGRLDLDLDARAGVAGGGLRETGAHVVGLGGEPHEVVAAGLAAYAHLVGDDVGRAAALDAADVRGRLRVDAPEPHAGDRLGGDLDRAHAALGRHAGVRRLAAYHDLEVVGARGAREGEADGVAVEDEAAPGAHPGEVQVLRAEESHLLADGEHHVERRVAETALAAHAHALADEGHAGLVVAAEDRRAVGADDVVLDDRLDALAGDDRVHVRAEEERGRVGGARQVRDQVARLAAERRPRAVEAHLRPQPGELAREPRGDPSLAARVAVDPDELQEERLQARGLDHERRTLARRSACRTPGGDVSSRAWRAGTRS